MLTIHHIPIGHILFGALLILAMNAWWHSGRLFGDRSDKSFVIVISVALLTAFVLAHIIDDYDATTLPHGALLGFWMWAGFVVSTTIMPNIVAQNSLKSTKGYLIKELVTYLMLGGALAILR